MTEYGQLKTRLAQRHRDDFEGYTEAKTAFIHNALTAALASAE